MRCAHSLHNQPERLADVLFDCVLRHVHPGRDLSLTEPLNPPEQKGLAGAVGQGAQKAIGVPKPVAQNGGVFRGPFIVGELCVFGARQRFKTDDLGTAKMAQNDRACGLEQIVPGTADMIDCVQSDQGRKGFLDHVIDFQPGDAGSAQPCAQCRLVR